MLNSYHTKARDFAGGNITEENKVGNHKLLHLKIPQDVYNELEWAAIRYEIATGRFAIELLRSWATKQANKRMLGE